MYDSPRRRPGSTNVVGSCARQTPVDAHEGSYRDYLRRHELEAVAAARGTRQQRRVFARCLLARAADTRNIMCAINHLAAKPKAPGPNGVRLETLSQRERWDLARTLGAQMRSGRYQTGPVRRIDVPKASGTGSRPLEILNAEDRVAQRAIAQVIQPFLDPLFDERSFGFRPGRGREEALATADTLITQTQRLVIITADIRDAFTRVPIPRLLDVLRHQGLADDLVQLIRRAIGLERHRGLPQGGPISPLLLNVYLDHLLDRLWRRRHPDIPLIRAADDLLVVCSGVDQAHQAYQTLQELLLPAGMQPKGSSGSDVRDIGRGEEADWLGYRLEWRDRRLQVGLGGKAWDQLWSRLSECHAKPESPLRAYDTVLGWIDQLGPCLHSAAVDDVHARVAEIGLQLGYEELPSIAELQEVWRRAHVRYRATRRSVYLASAVAVCDGSACRHHNPADTGRSSGASDSGAPLLPLFDAPAGELVHLWTDGSCLGSRGTGGWAYVLDAGPGSNRTYQSGSHPRATNNRMELTAVIRGLEAITRPSRVRLITDSQYVHDGLTRYLAQWRARRWCRLGGGGLENAPLWRQLAALIERHQVECHWVRGHAGHSENEMCDQLARGAAEMSHGVTGEIDSTAGGNDQI